MTQTLENPTVLSATRTREEYAEVLHGLSVASTEHHFDAFIDIPWEHPDFQIDRSDPRWILPANRSARRSTRGTRRSRWSGRSRSACGARPTSTVGLHFESILIRGLMEYCFWTPKNRSPEYRYCLHEAVEECNHNQMFQEMVNRIGVDVPGMPWLKCAASPGRSRVPLRRSRSVLVRHPRRRGADRPHAEERAARGQGPASDHGARDGHPRRRGGAAHLVRARVPRASGSAPRPDATFFLSLLSR